MRSDWTSKSTFEVVLNLLTAPNRLAIEVAAATGLRIGDVLSIKTSKLAERITVREQKTGKTVRVYIPRRLLREMRAMAGPYYVFENRLDRARPRTRQAVWKDVKRASRALRLKANITPHSARKLYAVDELARSGSMEAVQRKLYHSSSVVTAVYALADELDAMRRKSKNS